jgi:hypothetical protein
MPAADGESAAQAEMPSAPQVQPKGPMLDFQPPEL